MSLPTSVTSASNYDQSSDDPKQARTQLKGLRDDVDTINSHLKTSALTSGTNVLGVGNGLQALSGNLVAQANGVTLNVSTSGIRIADDVVLPGTGGLVVPTGTTAQQPGTPANGTLRYNTTTNKVEVYENGAWADVITAGGDTFLSTFTGDGTSDTEASFTLSDTYLTHIFVFEQVGVTGSNQTMNHFLRKTGSVDFAAADTDTEATAHFSESEASGFTSLVVRAWTDALATVSTSVPFGNPGLTGIISIFAPTKNDRPTIVGAKLIGSIGNGTNSAYHNFLKVIGDPSFTFDQTRFVLSGTAGRFFTTDAKIHHYGSHNVPAF